MYLLNLQLFLIIDDLKPWIQQGIEVFVEFELIFDLFQASYHTISYHTMAMLGYDWKQNNPRDIEG